MNADAAENLVGLKLDGGWRVLEKLDPGPQATGGNFCTGYLVESDGGLRGFCKALNLARALTSPDPARLLEQLTKAYNFECNILNKCAEARMSRVVLAISQGVVDVPGFVLPRVNYIIFEQADGDIRAALNTVSNLDIAAKLRCLHHVATGLQQLHRQHIAHQDLKPSNVLVFGGQESSFPDVTKVSDLGRATDRSMPAAHDGFRIAGDPTYAPPEQMYHATPVDFGPRRLGCDLHQLGSLVTFLFTGASMNALLYQELHPMHSWRNWGGQYQEVLPYLQDAYGRTITRISRDIPVPIRSEVAKMIRYLCDPDPDRRGHPQSRRQASGSPYELVRVVAQFDLLARRAEINLRNGA
ncbi:protein kinase [Micromonospora sp. NBC_01655]|uniref:protein kinase domain-containing protein n=1 Tax=Micromonospora sp. NBC_01655 TaxID=2975983 RepID=UPI00224D1958|nr:protein kinase [Micromonospora sp. NBC_01655]MCX4470718.1 protein kinase [Micromonospora sp. NBC_01655]